MDRLKTYDATGVAPNGRLYAGDLNLLQDMVAALTDLTQNLSVGSLAIGAADTTLTYYGPQEIAASGSFRTLGAVRAAGGLLSGSYTTAQRDAIVNPDYGLAVLNTSTNQYEWNSGTPAAPSWKPLGVDPAGSLTFTGATSQIAFTGENAVGNTVIRSRLAGDAQDRLAIRADGRIQFGSGGAAVDTFLYRGAANTLNTDGTFVVAGVSYAAAGGFRVVNPIGSSAYRGFLAAADAQPAFQITTDGKISWGPGGATAVDTNLYRSVAGQLKTDGTFIAGAGVYSNFGNANQIFLANDGHIYFNNLVDTSLYRYAAGVLKTDGGAWTVNALHVGAGGAGQFAQGANAPAIELSGTTPAIALTDTAQVTPAGRWQIYTSADTLYIYRSSSGNIMYLQPGSIEALQPLFQFDGAASMRVMRHPYGYHMHIEEKPVGIGGVSNFGNISVTHTDAFSQTPNAMVASYNDGVVIFVTSLSTTSCVVNARDLVNGGTTKTVNCGLAVVGVDN